MKMGIKNGNKNKSRLSHVSKREKSKKNFKKEGICRSERGLDSEKWPEIFLKKINEQQTERGRKQNEWIFQNSINLNSLQIHTHIYIW